MSASPDLIRQAKETYALEIQLADGLNSDALDKAISAALEAHERTVLQRIAQQAETFALAEEEDDNPDFAVALRWFAHKLRDDLGPQADGPYVPHENDVVEVTITGAVICWLEECENCDGEKPPEFAWSVLDDETGDEYFFRNHPRRLPRVRVLSRSEED